MVTREGFEPSKAEPTDLQSVPFDRSGTSPQPISLIFKPVHMSIHFITFFIEYQLEKFFI